MMEGLVGHLPESDAREVYKDFGLIYPRNLGIHDCHGEEYE
jgi:hypothetical protein